MPGPCQEKQSQWEIHIEICCRELAPRIVGLGGQSGRTCWIFQAWICHARGSFFFTRESFQLIGSDPTQVIQENLPYLTVNWLWIQSQPHNTFTATPRLVFDWITSNSSLTKLTPSKLSQTYRHKEVAERGRHRIIFGWCEEESPANNHTLRNFILLQQLTLIECFHCTSHHPSSFIRNPHKNEFTVEETQTQRGYLIYWSHTARGW